MTTCDREVVAVLGQAIAQRIGEPRYRLWFDGKTKMTWDGDQLTVGVPNCFYQEWLQKKFADDVGDAARDVLGHAMQLRFTIDAELFQAARQEQELGRHPKGNAPVPVASKPEASKPARSTQRLRVWRHLKDFVVGPCNRLAHTAALHVVEEPGQCANPLVLHGPVGTGKTHLLEGIYAGLRREHPDWRITLVTAEDFTNRFVQSMRYGKLGSFRKQFRDCDALLIDDVHFLAKKPATQEEFLHTFDVLQARGHQIVLSTDCHPRLAEELTPELTDRLLGGAVWGLALPEEATRLAILRAKSIQAEPAVPEEVLCLVASQLRGNVRELEGALHSLRHYGKVAGRPIDMPMAREALGELLRHSVRVVQLGDVERAVCQVLRLETGALRSKQRVWMVSHPRMVAIYLARKHTRAAYSEIGQHFGNRNHSTAVAAEKKVRGWLADDEVLHLGDGRVRIRDLIERIERELQR